MIIAYIFETDKEIKQVNLSPGDSVPEGLVWLDLCQPSSVEEEWVEKTFDISLPSMEEMDKIEVRSPFYKERENYHMTATVVEQHEDDYLRSAAVTFILTPKFLVVLRYVNILSLKSFSNYVLRYPKSYEVFDNVLTSILEVLINRIADILEEAGNELDKLLEVVFENPVKQEAMPSNYYNSIIRKIGHTGNLISKNRESLVSISRLLIYFSQIDDSKYFNRRENRFRLKHLNREIHSLSEYANFLSQRNSFLLDATLGMISVEQNMVIKAFTVAAAVFMPPTLIASIYGMNFHSMPELDWPWGYPLALLIIVISALLPYFFFKKKGWL